MAAQKLEFHCPMATLLKEGNLIITAGETFATELADRLQGTTLKDYREQLNKVSGDETDQKIAIGELGDLTLEQQRDYKTLSEIVSAAKETARKAFKGQGVKLREEFQVGVNKPHNLAANLMRAGIILAALAKPENLPALAKQGWIPADTMKLETAYKALGGADALQEQGKGDRLEATDNRNADANELYRNILAIQNAANLQFPASDPANEGTRLKFRLGIFPPSHSEPKKPADPAPAPTPTPPSP